jgi:hypothetical protein
MVSFDNRCDESVRRLLGLFALAVTPRQDTTSTSFPVAARSVPGNKSFKQDNADDSTLEETKKAPAVPPMVTLKLLIDEGLLTPGPDVLSLEYKGIVTTGSLSPDGRIEYQGRCYLRLLHP